MPPRTWMLVSCESQVEVSGVGWPPLHSVIVRHRQLVGPGPLGAVALWKKKGLRHNSLNPKRTNSGTPVRCRYRQISAVTVVISTLPQSRSCVWVGGGIPASYSEGPGFKSRPVGLFCLRVFLTILDGMPTSDEAKTASFHAPLSSRCI